MEQKSKIDQIIEEYYRSIPPSIQALLAGDAWRERLNDIARQYKLDNERTENLEVEIVMTILRIADLDTLADRLKSELRTERVTANTLAEEVEARIIGPMLKLADERGELEESVDEDYEEEITNNQPEQNMQNTQPEENEEEMSPSEAPDNEAPRPNLPPRPEKPGGGVEEQEPTTERENPSDKPTQQDNTSEENAETVANELNEYLQPKSKKVQYEDNHQPLDYSNE